MAGPFDVNLNARSGSKVLKPSTPPGTEDKTAELTPAFFQKLTQVAHNIGAEPKDLWAVIQAESTGDPAKVNPTSGATGFIQFMPAIAKKLGTSPEELKTMPPEQQLDYVEKYFKSVPGMPERPTMRHLYSAVFHGDPNAPLTISDKQHTLGEMLGSAEQIKAQMTPFPTPAPGPTAAPQAPVAPPVAPPKEEGGGFWDSFKGALAGGIPGMEKRPLSSAAPGIATGTTGAAGAAAIPDVAKPPVTQAPVQPPLPVAQAHPDYAPKPTPTPKTLGDVAGMGNKPTPAPVAPATPEPAATEPPVPPMPKTLDDVAGMGNKPSETSPMGVPGAGPQPQTLEDVAKMKEPPAENDPNFRIINRAQPEGDWLGAYTARDTTKSGRTTTAVDEANPVYADMKSYIEQKRKEAESPEAAGKAQSLTDYYGTLTADADKTRGDNLNKFLAEADDHRKKQMWDTIIQSLGGIAAGTMNLAAKGPGGTPLNVAKYYEGKPAYDRKYEDEIAAKELEQRNAPIGERVKGLLQAKTAEEELASKGAKKPFDVIGAYGELAKLAGGRKVATEAGTTTADKTTLEKQGQSALEKQRQEAELQKQREENEAKAKLPPKPNIFPGADTSVKEATDVNDTRVQQVNKARSIIGSVSSPETFFQAVTSNRGGSLPLSQEGTTKLWKEAEESMKRRTGRSEIPAQEVASGVLDILSNFFRTPTEEDYQQKIALSKRYGLPMPLRPGRPYFDPFTGLKFNILSGQ